MAELPTIHSMGGAGKKGKYSLGPSDRDPASIQRAQKFAQTLTSSSYAPHQQQAHLAASEKQTSGRQIDQSQSQSSRAPVEPQFDFHLSPAESYLAAHKEEIAEKWRSLLLKYETGIRELVANGSAEPPSLGRVVKVLKLYDGVCVSAEDQSPYLAELLRLFRVEFCRAIFSSYQLLPEEETGGKHADEDEMATYFDQVSYLMRENALLSSEVALGNTRERVVELTKEVAELNETIRLYENEVGRLTRQCDNLLDQYNKQAQKLEEANEKYEQQWANGEKELHMLNVENKDLQLQLFRLRKQAAGGKAKLLKDTYRQMKLTKMSTHATLFSEGDERIGLLVMLSQLESRLNEMLDRYDNDYMLTPPTMHVELRSKMGSSISVVLEEMHLCEQSYKRLVPCQQKDLNSEEPDETDGYVAIIFDHKVYENLLAREAIRKRLQFIWENEEMVAVPVAGAAEPPFGMAQQQQNQQQQQQPEGKKPLEVSHPSVTQSSITQPGSPLSPLESVTKPTTISVKEAAEEAHVSLEDLVFLKRNEWVERVFRTSPQELLIEKLGVKKIDPIHPHVIKSDVLLPRIVRNPMKDLSSKKFLSAIDVYSGKDPAQQKFLCAINYVDPSVPIQLPESTHFVKIKYKGSFFDTSVSPAESQMALPPGSARGELANNDNSNSDNRAGSANGPASTRAQKRKANTVIRISEKPTSRQLRAWGAKTSYKDEEDNNQNNESEESAVVFSVNENLRVFRELTNPLLLTGSGTAVQKRAAALSSTTASMVAFQRLNPLSPNRAPEWAVYKSLFGGYRSLNPRLLEVTTIDHILMQACERHFTRMEFRYEQCAREANNRATNRQMAFLVAERFFRESYQLSDFQDAIVDELESRYCYPELIAKNLYEILCYLDVMSGKDKLLDLYLNVIRGFQPPTHIHYITYMLFHLSYCWPTPNPSEEVSREDVLTVLRYLYRHCDNIVHVDINEVLKDYEMTTRHAPCTFVAMREFLGSAMIHQEDSMLLYLKGYYSTHCEDSDLQNLSYESYETATAKNFQEQGEQKSLIRYLSAALGFNRGPLLSVKDFALIAASSWCSEIFQ